MSGGDAGHAAAHPALWAGDRHRRHRVHRSAAAAGDCYGTCAILAGQGLATVATGLFGGVIQPTPYFGHPAYKAMVAHVSYPLAVMVVLAVGSHFGLLTNLYTWVPQAVLFPVIIFVGLETVSHSLKVTLQRHYPALALAAVPVIAYLALITVRLALGNRGARTGGGGHDADAVVPGQRFRDYQRAVGRALTTLLDGQPAGRRDSL